MEILVFNLLIYLSYFSFLNFPVFASGLDDHLIGHVEFRAQSEKSLNELYQDNLRSFELGPISGTSWLKNEDGCSLALTSRFPRVSDSVRAFGLKALVHMTTIEKTISIMKSGAVLTGEKVPIHDSIIGTGTNRPGQTFLDFSRQDIPFQSEDAYYIHNSRRGRKQGDPPAVYLVYDLQLLDAGRYHIAALGTEWMSGFYHPLTDFHYTLFSYIDRFLNAVKGIGPGEVVFYQDIPNHKYLRAIWAESAIAGQIYSSLKSGGIESINGIALDKLIVPVQVNRKIR